LASFRACAGGEHGGVSRRAQPAVEWSRGAIDYDLSATYGLENDENVLRSTKAAAYYLGSLDAKLTRIQKHQKHQPLNSTVSRAQLLRIGYNNGAGEEGGRDWMGEVALKNTRPLGTPAETLDFFGPRWELAGRLLELASVDRRPDLMGPG
jgi:hypothetical protein